MIDFTPNHQYTEIIDSDVQAEISANKSTQIVIAIAVVASIICLFLGFQNLSWWIMIPITIIMIPVWIVALFFYALASYRPLSKAQVASIIKNVIGFDFGDDFTLLQTSSHDHEEYLYLFSESSFEPLKKHLDSIPDKDGQEGERSIKHQISVRLPTEIFPTPKAGFYLCDNRQVNGMGNIEAIEVDYQERTLKHTFTIYWGGANRTVSRLCSLLSHLQRFDLPFVPWFWNLFITFLVLVRQQKVWYMNYQRRIVLRWFVLCCSHVWQPCAFSLSKTNT